MPDVALSFGRDEYAARLAKTRAGDGGARDRAAGRHRPLEHGLAHRLRRLVILRPPGVLVSPDGDPVWYGRGQDANGASAPCWMPPSESSASPTTTCSPPSATRWTTSRASSGTAAGAGRGSASRWTTSASRAAAYRGAAARAAGRALRDATGARQLAAGGEVRGGAGYMRTAAPIVEAMHARILEKVEPGMRKCDLVAGDLDAGTRGVDGAGGDYRGDRAAAAVGLRRRGAAPDLGRPADAAGEGTFFEIAGVLPALPLPAVAHASSSASRRRRSSTPRRRCSRAWRPGSRRRGRATLRGHRQGVLRGAARYGIGKDNRTGYSIGLSYPPDWGERTMSLRPGDRTGCSPA